MTSWRERIWSESPDHNVFTEEYTVHAICLGIDSVNQLFPRRAESATPWCAINSLCRASCVIWEPLYTSMLSKHSSVHLSVHIICEFSFAVDVRRQLKIIALFVLIFFFLISLVISITPTMSGEGYLKLTGNLYAVSFYRGTVLCNGALASGSRTWFLYLS